MVDQSPSKTRARAESMGFDVRWCGARHFLLLREDVEFYGDVPECEAFLDSQERRDKRARKD